MREENPTGRPSLNIPQESWGNGITSKAAHQTNVKRFINLHSHPLNPANKGDVRTPTPQPTAASSDPNRFSAYMNKSKPDQKTSAE